MRKLKEEIQFIKHGEDQLTIQEAIQIHFRSSLNPKGRKKWKTIKNIILLFIVSKLLLFLTIYTKRRKDSSQIDVVLFALIYTMLAIPSYYYGVVLILIAFNKGEFSYKDLPD